jgi:hypothetical protein
MNVELHSVIHFLWIRGTGNDQILSHMQETYGTNAISLRMAQQWTNDFATEKPSSIPPQGRVGRPVLKPRHVSEG